TPSPSFAASALNFSSLNIVSAVGASDPSAGSPIIAIIPIADEFTSIVCSMVPVPSGFTLMLESTERQPAITAVAASSAITRSIRMMFSRAIRRPALAPDDKLPRGFMFSARLPESVAPTPLSARMDEAKRLGRIRADLTLSNPTAADILYPETLAAAWSNVAALRYEPRSLGLPEAREAVAAAVAEGAWTPSPDRVVLTASTSEAYA